MTRPSSPACPRVTIIPRGQRVTAVMVNNISNTSYQQARPQNGLSEADVLIEIKVEGGITRFAPLFTDYRDLPGSAPCAARVTSSSSLSCRCSRFMCAYRRGVSADAVC